MNKAVDHKIIEQQTALTDAGARGLAIATRTVPQMSRITPRWLTHLLQWVPLEAGIYRVNRVKDASSVTVDCSARDERVLPETFVDYDENPREYQLSAVTTVVEVHTRISDLYGNPYDQIAEQLRLTVEIIKERQESELINNAEYGLLSSAVPAQRIKSRTGRPTPDDMDDLIVRVAVQVGDAGVHLDDGGDGAEQVFARVFNVVDERARQHALVALGAVDDDVRFVLDPVNPVDA